jgi:3-hydroxyisobutyrate dehydrogenase-like beta-hydroxyacid dehydrogenase
MPLPSHVCMIGLGEVGRIFAEDLKALGVARVTAFDVLFRGPASKPSRNAAEAGVEVCASADEAVRGAELVVSAVTAAQAMAAAREIAPALAKDAFVLDVNSASPGVKQAASQLIDAAGGRYVEAAVMSSYPPKRIRTPKLLGGAHAPAFLEFARDLELNARIFSEEVGPASATKMCRSVMIKGVEALLAECLLSARRYGVEKTVLGSLGDLLPNPDWEKHARYMISRSLLHGKRRAEEMREVARTVEDAGVEPCMSRAAAERQDWAWRMAQELAPGEVDDQDLYRLLDAVRRVMEQEDGVEAAAE